MTFMEEMLAIEKALLSMGFSEVLLPMGFGGNDKKKKAELSVEEDGKRKIDHNLIEKHYLKIVSSDCILVVNHKKNGVENYIGGNTLLEMGFAYINKKPIFLLNPMPEISYKPEIIGMKPTVINGDLGILERFATQHARRS